jgi:DNA-binding LacI/PurR family transcriptional regulator
VTLASVARPTRGARAIESVGVVIPEPGSALFSDPVLPSLLSALGGELFANGVQMVLFAPSSAADVSRLERYLAGGHVDAVVILAMPESETFPDMLRARGVPFVLGSRPRRDLHARFVDVDNQAGGRRATEHLINQGRRRIAHVAGPENLQSAADRTQGFRDAMWSAALRSDLIEHSNLDRDAGEMAMSRLLSRRDDIDAVFVASDAMAAGAMWAVQVLGRRVPDDVAIIGFDDSPIALSTQPPLSSVRRPVEEMAREMTRLVVEMSEAEVTASQQLILDPVVAVRESTCRTNGRRAHAAAAASALDLATSDEPTSGGG